MERLRDLSESCSSACFVESTDRGDLCCAHNKAVLSTGAPRHRCIKLDVLTTVEYRCAAFLRRKVRSPTLARAPRARRATDARGICDGRPRFFLLLRTSTSATSRSRLVDRRARPRLIEVDRAGQPRKVDQPKLGSACNLPCNLESARPWAPRRPSTSS